MIFVHLFFFRFSSTKWLVAGDDDLPHSPEEETSDDWPPFKKVFIQAYLINI